MPEIVNIVGPGSLDSEFDLERVAADIGSIAEYDPDKYPGMYLRCGEDAPLITVYRTGKYIVEQTQKRRHTRYGNASSTSLQITE